ncbi:MAG: HEAT repeat domain-containing protein [bacterium]|nr:HEAT repeat domain-containing protein [bacterium]
MNVRAFPTATILLVLLATLAGCGWSPLRPRFDPFDEAYKDTWFARRAQWEQVRNDVGALSPEETAKLANELVATMKEEPNPLIRQEAAKTLAALPGETAGRGLLIALRDDQQEIRTVACNGLGRRGGATAISELTRVYNEDKELDVRLAAVRALGRLQEPGAIATLGEALDDPDPAVNYVAISSLKNVSGENLGNDVRPWREYVASVTRGDRPIRTEGGGSVIPNPLKNWF